MSTSSPVLTIFFSIDTRGKSDTDLINSVFPDSGKLTIKTLKVGTEGSPSYNVQDD
jgi:hypothetical protein